MQIGTLVSLLTVAALTGTAMQEKQKSTAEKQTTAEPRPAPQTETVGVNASLKAAIVVMDRVAADLKKAEVSPTTIKQQKEILSELDRLVSLAETLPPPNRGRPTDGSKPPGSKAAAPPNRAKETSGQPAGSPINQANPTRAGGTPAEQRRVLVKQIWGHLPPSLQRRVLTGTNEKPVPKYQRLIKRYFQALAESSQRRPTKTDESPTR